MTELITILPADDVPVFPVEVDRLEWSTDDPGDSFDVTLTLGTETVLEATLTSGADRVATLYGIASLLIERMDTPGERSLDICWGQQCYTHPLLVLACRTNVGVPAAGFTQRRFLTLLDTCVIGLPIGQILGRWGNFFNREAFGQYTNGLFAMQLPVSAVRQNEITSEMWEHAVTVGGVQYIQVTPTFLYEGLWNCGVLLALFLLRNHTKFRGEEFLIYVAGYGIGRFWIESLRTDQLLIPGTQIPVSMVVSAVAAGLAILVIIYKHVQLARREAAV